MALDLKTGRELRQIISALDHALEQQETSDTLVLSGLAQLLGGKAKDGTAQIEKAVAQAPGRSALHTDLSLAYLERAHTGGSNLDLIKALENASMALRIHPGHAGALFNRALALGHLHLDEMAARSWAKYLEAHPDSRWRAEVQERHAEVSKPKRWTRWPDARAQLVAAAETDSNRVREVANLFPQPTRELVGELLAAWAQDYTAGYSARAAAGLTRAKTVAAAVFEVTGDSLARDSVAVLERTDPRIDRQLAELARGHLAFAEGKALYDALEYSRAAVVLKRAILDLERGGSPFVAWARFYRAVCDYWSGRRDQAFKEFSDLRRQPENANYSILRGYASWMSGLMLALESELGASLPLYLQALTNFETTRQTQNIAALHFLLAEYHGLMGEPQQVWKHLGEALARTEQIQTARWRHTIFKEAADVAQESGYPLAALTFQGQAIQASIREGQPAVLAEAFASRAVAHSLLGQSEEARKDLDQADEALSRITDPGLEQRIQAQLSAAASQVLSREEPERAVELLGRAIGYFDTSRFDSQLTTLYLNRGRAYLRLGETALAERDFLTGIDIFERHRGLIYRKQARIAYFDQARELFDEMIRLGLDHHRDPERAWRFAEQLRARELLDTVADSPSTTGLSPSEIIPHLPPSVAILHFAMLDERLLTWVFRDNQMSFFEQSYSAAYLTREIEALLQGFEEGAAWAELEPQSSTLYDALLRPLERALDGVETLVILPDKALYQLPFTALFDQGTERFLLERYAVSVAPSTSLLLYNSRRVHQQADGEVLAVGDPRFDAHEYPLLDQLPGAIQEVHHIARLFPETRLLVREEATAQRFFEMAGRHRIVHLGSHALPNREFPLLSRLVLAPDSVTGRSGTILAHEIYEHEFPATRLVVLAACGTATGRISVGEGVLSLARPFLAAGVPEVVASLWYVDDQHSAALFEGFYRELREGAVPVKALRRAQLQMLYGEDEKLHHPRAWAAFEAIGIFLELP